MTKPNVVTTIAILMPEYMGHACRFVFRENGFCVITCFAGSSQHTINLPKELVTSFSQP